jgi:hypothetical protein
MDRKKLEIHQELSSELMEKKYPAFVASPQPVPGTRPTVPKSEKRKNKK